MRIVVDTNVFVSGVFFAGPSYEVLDAWRHGFVRLVSAPEILQEYRRVGGELALRSPDVELEPWLQLLASSSILVHARALPEQVCRDPDDDKFLACAIAGGTKIVVSGDKALRDTSGYAGITVLTPREFVERYLKKGM